MNIIDLSHTINETMPVYPGMASPVLKTKCTIEQDGFYERDISIYSHAGTHIDAPAHVLTDGKTLDQLPVDKFAGSCCVVDLSGLETNMIDLDYLVGFHCIIEMHDYVLLWTGWDKKWGTNDYFKGYPVLDREATEWLAGFPHMKGIGIDAISVDAVDSITLDNHRILFEKEIIVVENLTNLGALPVKEFSFSCFPLNFSEADGSPVRAVGYVPVKRI